MQPDLAPSDPAARIDAVAALLAARYGRPRWRPRHPPLDELVLTVLSQHTSDANAERAYRSLRSRFPDWESVPTAATADVADAIRSGGLANIKASRIQGILAQVRRERGRLALDHLAAMPIDEARRWLLRLNGVGPKTAACVLLFSLGRTALPVDTHVHRVARRIGLIGPRVDARLAHDVLEAHLGADRDRVYAFHLNAIAHGRTVCTARRPSCERCSLTGCCDDYAERHGRVPLAAAPTPPPPGGG